MLFQTVGNELNPVILFFHAMGVTGESSKVRQFGAVDLVR